MSKKDGMHDLACCEYHSHHAPDCCSYSCWCQKEPKGKWVYTVTFRMEADGQLAGEVRRKGFEALNAHLYGNGNYPGTLKIRCTRKKKNGKRS